MSYELPFQRRVERQARPRAVFGKMNPGHGLGSASGISEIPPIKNIVKKARMQKLANGGICYMADGGDYNPEGIGFPVEDSLDPMGGQQNPFAVEKPEGPTGFGGWLQNKHGGITGENWLQAAAQLFTGITGGILAKRNNSKDAGPNTGTSFAPMGALGGYAHGGIVEPLDGPRRMAEGGEAPAMQPGAPQPQEQMPGGDPRDQMIVANAIKAILGQSQDPRGAIQAFVQRFGQEALQSLVQKVQESAQQGSGGGQQMAPQQGGMARGGILSGPGDGLSDSIPANGGNLRVADGEYLLSSSDVANIGNGSSSAGARKLDAAREALRHKKTGTTKLPPRVHDSSNPVLNSFK